MPKNHDARYVERNPSPVHSRTITATGTRPERRGSREVGYVIGATGASRGSRIRQADSNRRQSTSGDTKEARTIDELKRKIPIDRVIEWLGGQIQRAPIGAHWTGWIPTLCPWHEDHNPSAGVNRSTGKFMCHGCEVHGDIIDMAQLFLGTDDKREAMEWLRETFLRSTTDS